MGLIKELIVKLEERYKLVKNIYELDIEINQLILRIKKGGLK